MKKYVVILLLSLLAMPVALFSQESGMPALTDSMHAASSSIVERINKSGHMKVEHPAALDARLQKVQSSDNVDSTDEYERKDTQGRVGYRIQAFDDNNPGTARQGAESRKRQMESRFPEWRSYVEFNSPYWRVKVGDFRSRSEVEAAIEEMRHAFPGLSSQLRIVRDRINISE